MIALGAALALAFALWAYGMSERASGRARLGARAAAALALLLALFAIPNVGVGAPPAANGAPSGTLAYEPYSAAKLASLRAEGRPVFVNATAAWCITCLVNEKVALSSGEIERAFSERKIAALKADWTNQNPEISALLAAHGRDGVPLYLYFAPGSDTPKVLPQLLTQSTVMAALTER